jgi:hypothetical protein
MHGCPGFLHDVQYPAFVSSVLQVIALHFSGVKRSSEAFGKPYLTYHFRALHIECLEALTCSPKTASFGASPLV